MVAERVLALVVLAALAACDDPPCWGFAEGFEFTSPTGASELLPGEPVTWEWLPGSADDADVKMAITLRGTNRILGVGSTTLPQGRITVVREDVTTIPPDVYQIEVTFSRSRCDFPEMYQAGVSLSVYAQGIAFVDTGIIIVNDETPRQIMFRSVSLSTMDVELYVDPSTTTDGDELRFARGTLQGERVASFRTLPFTGMTTEGAEIPGGDYHLLGRVHARDGIVYDIPGPTLRWVLLP